MTHLQVTYSCFKNWHFAHLWFFSFTSVIHLSWPHVKNENKNKSKIITKPNKNTPSFLLFSCDLLTRTSHPIGFSLTRSPLLTRSAHQTLSLCPLLTSPDVKMFLHRSGLANWTLVPVPLFETLSCSTTLNATEMSLLLSSSFLMWGRDCWPNRFYFSSGKGIWNPWFWNLFCCCFVFVFEIGGGGDLGKIGRGWKNKIENWNSNWDLLLHLCYYLIIFYIH